MAQDKGSKNGNPLNGVWAQNPLTKTANTDNLFDLVKESGEDFSVTFSRAVNNISQYSTLSSPDLVKKK